MHATLPPRSLTKRPPPGEEAPRQVDPLGQRSRGERKNWSEEETRLLLQLLEEGAGALRLQYLETEEADHGVGAGGVRVSCSKVAGQHGSRTQETAELDELVGAGLSECGVQ